MTAAAVSLRCCWRLWHRYSHLANQPLHAVETKQQCRRSTHSAICRLTHHIACSTQSLHVCMYIYIVTIIALQTYDFPMVSLAQSVRGIVYVHIVTYKHILTLLFVSSHIIASSAQSLPSIRTYVPVWMTTAAADSFLFRWRHLWSWYARRANQPLHAAIVCTYVRTYVHCMYVIMHFIPVWMTMADVVSFCWRMHCWYRRFAIQLLTPVTMAAEGWERQAVLLASHNHTHAHATKWTKSPCGEYVHTYVCMHMHVTRTQGYVSVITIRMRHFVHPLMWGRGNCQLG